MAIKTSPTLKVNIQIQKHVPQKAHPTLKIYSTSHKKIYKLKRSIEYFSKRERERERKASSKMRSFVNENDRASKLKTTFFIF